MAGQKQGENQGDRGIKVHEKQCRLSQVYGNKSCDVLRTPGQIETVDGYKMLPGDAGEGAPTAPMPLSPLCLLGHHLAIACQPRHRRGEGTRCAGVKWLRVA